MKNKFFLILISIAGLGMILQSCDPVDPTPTDSKVEVVADITEPTIWTGDKTYIINKYDFNIESTLTIEAGAVIKFPTAYKYLTLSGEGKIIANGSSISPIIFTSYKDDNNGGDSNDDGGESIPAVGDWANIDLNGQTGSEFTYCKFLYGGNGTDPSATLELSGGASATITNCTFAFNGGGENGNSYIGALNAESADPSTVITNNTFYNNVLPISIAAEINMDNSNAFSYNGNNNNYNGIFVSGGIGRDVSWLETEVAYVLTSLNTPIMVDGNLTLGNGVVLKFTDDAYMDIQLNENAITNYNGVDVYFTSYKDDELKGDTNGDQSLSSPTTADWVGIYIYDLSKSAGYATWDNIRYNDPNPSSK